MQDSPDLKTWSDIATYSGTNIVLTAQATEISRTGAPTERVTLRETVGTSGSRAHFLRVDVTRP